MVSYYDFILGLIPLVLVAGTGLLHVGGLELTPAVSLAGVAAVLLVGHALFVRAPVDTESTAAGNAGAPVSAD